MMAAHVQSEKPTIQNSEFSCADNTRVNFIIIFTQYCYERF